MASIERGLLLLVGVEPTDTEREAAALAAKVAALRIFPAEAADAMGRSRPMELDVRDVGGALLVVSQFTLAASVRKGRRPGFEGAAAPDLAEPLYLEVAAQLRRQGVEDVQTGQFGADMAVTLCNDGPVTLLLAVRDGRVQ